MIRALGAAGLLLRRLRNERGIALLTVALIGGTSFLFAAAPRIFNRVADDALRYAVEVAPPTRRNIALAMTDQIPTGPAAGVDAVRRRGEDLASRFPASVDALISDRSLRLTTIRFVVSDPPLQDTRVSLRYQDGITDATRLVAGRWPVDRGEPLRPQEFDEEGRPLPLPTEPAVFEVALSTATATTIGAGIGDRLAMTPDGSDLAVRSQRVRVGPAAIEVVGLFEPVDPAADDWAGDTGLLAATEGGGDFNPIAFATAYVPAEAYPNLAGAELLFRFEWRFRVDPARLDASKVPQLQLDFRRLGRTGVSAPDQVGSVGIVTGLPGILDRYAAERALAEAVVSVAAIGPLGLAAAAVAMVAIFAVRRRIRSVALARGRGASGALVLGTQLWEGGLLAGGAALAGLALATTLVAARPTTTSPLLAIVIALGALALLLGATWALARRPLGALERDDPPVLRVAPRRLVFEATIVAVAVGASLLLRQRGLVLDEASGVARFDPLLASVPVLTGFAAGIVAVRVFPVPIRLLGWLAARRRDVVPVLGLRTVGRLPAAANLPVLVLMLTAGFGAFASVVASSLTEAQVTGSYIAIGADYRVERVGIGSLGPAVDPARIPGVEAVVEGLTDTAAAFASNDRQRASIFLQAFDAPGYTGLTDGTAAAPHLPAALLAEPPAETGGERVGSPDQPIPAVLSNRLPSGSAELAPGDTFRMTIAGRPLTFRVAERRATFPGLGNRPTFAIVPLAWVRGAVDELLSPTILWLRASDEVAGPLADAVAAAPGNIRIVSRYEALADVREAPFSTVIVMGYWLALAIAAGYMALTIVGAMVLSAERRTQDLAYLRALGFSAPQAVGLTFMEQAPPVALALAPGLALGIGVAALCVPGLGLAAFAGATDVATVVDWASLAVLLVALVGVVAVAVVAGSWVSGRARVIDALRYADN